MKSTSQAWSSASSWIRVVKKLMSMKRMLKRIDSPWLFMRCQKRTRNWSLVKQSRLIAQGRSFQRIHSSGTKNGGMEWWFFRRKNKILINSNRSLLIKQMELSTTYKTQQRYCSNQITNRWKTHKRLMMKSIWCSLKMSTNIFKFQIRQTSHIKTHLRLIKAEPSSTPSKLMLNTTKQIIS